MLSTVPVALGATILLAFASPALAQGPAFQTPGMPGFGEPAQLEDTQTSRFSRAFNPAVSFVVDVAGDWQNAAGHSPDDGSSLALRALELGAQAWVDPRAWAYFIGATEGEELAIEEAALHYVGFAFDSTIRAGRFFVDFGKQMQVHVHELRTVERPLVLRAYLGEEVKGDGVQWDHWVPVGDATVVRWSIGAFQSLLPEEDEVFPDDERTVDERKGLGDLNFTARLTGFTDLTDSATLQAGLSARLVPDYTIEFGAFGDAATSLSNQVYGVDLTYGCVDDSGQRRWTSGVECLFNAGDNGGENPAAGTMTVFDETVQGFYAFSDLAWDPYNSAGVQFSTVELPDAQRSRLSETEAYYTRRFSEYQRLRVGVIGTDAEVGRDSVRAVLQYTVTVGAHGHGINW